MAQYTIIGADGKEYGLISAEQARQWLAQGRLTSQSRVQAEGSNNWKPLAEFAELQPSCSGNITAAGVPAKTCGMAVASLVLGCLTLFCSLFTAIPGIILGIVGLSKINKSAGTLTGKGMAIAGICLSAGLFVFALAFHAALILPALTHSRDQARCVQCMNNLKQLGLAIGMYYDDNDQRMPTPSQWCDALSNYVGHTKSLFRCPSAPPQQRCFYALVPRAKWQAANNGVLIIEGVDKWNAVVSGPADLGTPPHRGGYNVLFTDGHVEFVRKERLGQLQW